MSSSSTTRTAACRSGSTRSWSRRARRRPRRSSVSGGWCERHHELTGSARAAALLAEWDLHARGDAARAAAARPRDDRRGTGGNQGHRHAVTRRSARSARVRSGPRSRRRASAQRGVASIAATRARGRSRGCPPPRGPSTMVPSRNAGSSTQIGAGVHQVVLDPEAARRARALHDPRRDAHEPRVADQARRSRRRHGRSAPVRSRPRSGAACRAPTHRGRRRRRSPVLVTSATSTSAFASRPCFPRTGSVESPAIVTAAPSSRRRITVTQNSRSSNPSASSTTTFRPSSRPDMSSCYRRSRGAELRLLGRALATRASRPCRWR